MEGHLYPFLDRSQHPPPYNPNISQQVGFLSFNNPETSICLEENRRRARQKQQEYENGWYKYKDTEYVEFVKYMEQCKKHFEIGRDELYLHILNLNEYKSNNLARLYLKMYVKLFDTRYGNLRKFQKMRNKEILQQTKRNNKEIVYIKDLMNKLL